MAFTLPNFNVNVKGWHHGHPTSGPRDWEVHCNFNVGRRVVTGPDSGFTTGVDSFYRYLLLPRGTDIRGPFQAGGADTVEVPAGSGFFYEVHDAERVALQFSNEHLRAILSPLAPLPNF